MREARELQTLIDQLEAYIREQDEAIKALQKTNEYLVEQLRQALAQSEQASIEPPDYVEPPTSDYHNGWEEGFEAAKNLFKKESAPQNADPRLLLARKDNCTALAQPEQEPVAHAVIAGVLFDFMGWLTSRSKRLVLSASDEASPAVKVIEEFAKMRGLSLDDAKVKDWQDMTAPPKREWVGLSVNEARDFFESKLCRENLITEISGFLEEKNT